MITNLGVDARNIGQIKASYSQELKTHITIDNLRRCLRCFLEDNLTTNDIVSINRCLNDAVQSDQQLVVLDDYLFALNGKVECGLDTIKLISNIVQFLNDGCEDFLRVGQTLLTEQNLSVVEVCVNRLSSTEGCDLVDVGVLIDVHLFDELSTNLTTRDILTTSQLQLTKHVETSRVVILQDLLTPTVDGNRGLNNVGEVLVEEGVLDLLDDFRRFTYVIDESTRSLCQGVDVKNALSEGYVIDNTRCTRHRTIYTLTNHKCASSIDKFQDLGTKLPTIVLGNICNNSCIFFTVTLINFLTLKESGGFNHCLCSTTEDLGKQDLATSTLSQECNKVTRLSVGRSQCKTKLVTFQRVGLTSNRVVGLTHHQTGQTSRTGLRQFANSSAHIIRTELNGSTVGDTMWEVKLQVVQVEVNNIVKLRLQSHNRF